MEELSSLDKLERLQSFNHSHLLDVIDKLREQGLSNFLPLPQLIVCGDQSSGKSSVLEAISGVPFPKKDSLCTRFATEVVLRRSSATEQTRANVSILPGQDRSEIDQSNLRNFNQSLPDVRDLPDAIQRAKEAMGLGSQGSNAFSTDVLRLEVTGPCMPQLTIVDLPGLIHSENKFQTAQDVELVSKLVKSYMSQRRSIILAVVSAKNDHANQIVLKRAREEDPTGQRTMGVITKPDTLHKNSSSESAFLGLARNQDVSFNLGWHVVRNLDSNEVDVKGDRDQMESAFFHGSNWRSLGQNFLGAPSLRKRLSGVLFEQITRELPSLMQELESNRQECQDELTRLGRSRKTEMEQRIYLAELNQKAYDACKAGCNGIYDDLFFGEGDEIGKENETIRFRSVIQNQGIEFAKVLEKRGPRWIISNESAPSRNMLTKSQAIDRVVALLQRSRGRELLGTYDPMLISKLFQEYSKPWEGIVREYVNNVWQSAKSFIDLVLRKFADETVTETYSRLVLDPEMDNVLNCADKALMVLLEERKRHASTFNHYFSQNFVKMQNKRLEEQIKSVLGDGSSGFYNNRALDKPMIDRIIATLTVNDGLDMDRAAAEDMFDKMQAYYQVAMKRLVDNVPHLVIERVIVKHLLSVFEPLRVYEMSESLVGQIAGESTEKEKYREALAHRLDIMRNGEVLCKRYIAQADVLDTAFSDLDSDATPQSHEPSSPSNKDVDENVEKPRPPTELEKKIAELSLAQASEPVHRTKKMKRPKAATPYKGSEPAPKAMPEAMEVLVAEAPAEAPAYDHDSWN